MYLVSFLWLVYHSPKHVNGFHSRCPEEIVIEALFSVYWVLSVNIVGFFLNVQQPEKSCG